MKDNLESIKIYGDLAEWSKYPVVIVYPDSDDPDQLCRESQKLRLCARRDLYWLYKNNRYFVMIMSSHSPDSFMFSGAVLDVTNADKVHRGSINVRTDKFPVNADVIEAILDRLAVWMDDNPDELKRIYRIRRDPQTHGKFAYIIDNIDE